MSDRKEILEKLEKAHGIEFKGAVYFIVCRDLEDLPEELEPYITVISPYSGADNLWVEWDIFVYELLDDPNIKLYTLSQIYGKE